MEKKTVKIKIKLNKRIVVGGEPRREGKTKRKKEEKRLK